MDYKNNEVVTISLERYENIRKYEEIVDLIINSDISTLNNEILIDKKIIGRVFENLNNITDKGIYLNKYKNIDVNNIKLK
jgi:hypothetical protein